MKVSDVHPLRLDNLEEVEEHEEDGEGDSEEVESRCCVSIAPDPDGDDDDGHGHPDEFASVDHQPGQAEGVFVLYKHRCVH